MMFFLIIAFLAEIVLLLRFEFKFFKSDFSPILFLGFPFFIVSVLAFSIGPYLGFYIINTQLMLIWISGVFIFWAAGILSTAFTLPVIKKKFNTSTNMLIVSETMGKLILYLSWFFIFVLLFRLTESLIIFNNPGSDEFTKYFAGGGFTGHCMAYLRFNMVYMIATFKKKKFFYIIPIIFSIFLLFMYQSKSWLFLPIFAGLIGRMIINKKRPGIAFFLKLLVVVTIGFALLYYVSLHNIRFSFLSMHFGAYLFSGVIGFSRHIELSLPLDVDFSFLILPVKNMISLMTQSDISSDVSTFFVTINEQAQKVANVKSYFGTIFIYGGLIEGAILTFLSGYFLYFLYIFSFYSRKLLPILLYTLFLSAIFLGWFDFYFNKLFFYEIFVYAGILWIIDEILKNKEALNK